MFQCEPPNECRRVLRCSPSESTSRVCIRMEVEGYFTVQCTWIWWRSREHKFSADLPLPDCHEGARGIWTKRLFQDEDYGRKYLVRHAIDINHVEEVFQLGSLSSLALIHHRRETQGYDVVPTNRKIQTGRRYAMLAPKLWRFFGSSTPSMTWITSPQARPITQKTVVVRGRNTMVQCCPI